MKILNPAFDYDSLGHNYSSQRKEDPRIGAYLLQAMGDAKTVLNVGAGAGSYEPTDRYVVAVEPSVVMRSQRAMNGRVPAIHGKSDALPFDDHSFDASMALVTVHHWLNLEKGLQEMRRVTKDKVLILTFDPERLEIFWKADYFKELIAVERARYPTLSRLCGALGGQCEIIRIPVPFDCTDGFEEAFYGRPEAFLQKEVRMAQSAWGFLDPGVEERLVHALAKDLASGIWDQEYGHFRTQPYLVGALTLIVSAP